MLHLDSLGLNTGFFRARGSLVRPRDLRSEIARYASLESGKTIVLDPLLLRLSGPGFASARYEPENKHHFTERSADLVESAANNGVQPDGRALCNVHEKPAWVQTVPTLEKPWSNARMAIHIYGCTEPSSDGSCPRGAFVGGREDLVLRTFTDGHVDEFLEYTVTLSATVQASTITSNPVLSLTLCQNAGCRHARETWEFSTAEILDGAGSVSRTVRLIPRSPAALSFRLEWSGDARVCVDALSLENAPGRRLLDGAFDEAIGERLTGSGIVDAQGKANQAIAYIALADEPILSHYENWRYVAHHLKDTFGLQSATALNPGMQSMPELAAEKFRHFVGRMQPDVIWTNLYPQTAEIAHPDIPAAHRFGLPAFGDGKAYNDAMQLQFDRVAEKLSALRSVMSETGLPQEFWYIPATFGDVPTDGYRRFRPPAKHEIWATTNMALAFGAAGILYYVVQSRPCTEPSDAPLQTGLVDCAQQHTDDYDRLPNTGERIYTGYRSNWEAVRMLNDHIAHMASHLRDLDYVTSYRYAGSPARPDGIRIDEPDGTAKDLFVGRFTDGSNDHYLVVNLRTAPDPDTGSYEDARRDLVISATSADTPMCPTKPEDTISSPRTVENGFAVTLSPGGAEVLVFERCR